MLQDQGRALDKEDEMFGKLQEALTDATGQLMLSSSSSNRLPERAYCSGSCTVDDISVTVR